MDRNGARKRRTELREPNRNFLHFDLQSRLQERLSSTERLLTSARATLRTSEAIVKATREQVGFTADQLERLDS